jgi:hypothetical protein
VTTVSNSLRRPMDMGQIVNTAIRVYRRNFGEFVAMAAVTLPISAAAAIVSGMVADATVAAIVTVAFAIPNIAVGLIAQAAITRAVADVDEGVAADFNSSYGRVLPLVGRLFLTALRVAVIVVALGVTIVGIPFALYYMIRWAFFTQAIVIEGASSGEATTVSSRVVQGNWWRTLGILFVLGLLAGLPSAVIALIFSPAAVVAGSLASAVAAVIVFPFSAVATTLLFFDLQSRERERVSVA